jgi:hypothetical protein
MTDASQPRRRIAAAGCRYAVCHRQVKLEIMMAVTAQIRL